MKVSARQTDRQKYGQIDGDREGGTRERGGGEGGEKCPFPFRINSWPNVILYVWMC